MAIHVGRATLAAGTAEPSDIGWVIHCGSGYQGTAGWPVHHHIQDGIVGGHGTAFELRQYCAGGLTSWAIADLMAASGSTVICTGGDNWSWDDRFATSRSVGGEPFSDVAHATVISPRAGFAKILATATASCPDQSSLWRTREAYWEHAGRDDFRAAYSRAVGSRTPDANRDSFHMLARAVITALTAANLSPQYVTHFVPHDSTSGEPYRSVAKAVGLPWEESLHQSNLDHGYLGVSTQVAGLVQLAESGELQADSIVLLLAAEYQLSATAVVLRIIRPPVVSADGVVRTAA
ncbi:3-oxoacyl-[acyl-carrier-protein] synthase III C-terminal domain-containing protein [Mycobacterium heidelbergense]|uniref:3-oxoacyl-[acyl-carrier-protein] synthase III C-terminal domain-containing protein n=1 Tax=Mycobacterium heidelbergense TaxID=53376 RepID=UPI003CF0E5F9